MSILLNEYLKVSKEDLEERGVFNAVIGIDTKLFVDPVLLPKSSSIFFKDSRNDLQNYFRNVIKLLKFKNNLRVEKEIIKKLTFPEPVGISIGYGNESEEGAGVGPEKARMIYKSVLEVYNMGLEEPEIFEIIGIFEEGFGPDLISDITVNILQDSFCKYTIDVCKSLGLDVFFKYKGYLLPKHPTKEEPLLFVPRDILRDLPVANSWEEVFDLANHNSDFRKDVNSFLKESFKIEGQLSKRDYKNILFKSKTNLEKIIDIYKKYDAVGYDFENDPKGLGSWFSLGLNMYRSGVYTILKKPENSDELLQAAHEVVDRYRRAIEENGSNKILYGIRDGKLKPYNEETAQLIFYSLGDNYCRDRNILFVREPNAGSGPVDFSMGVSYDAKVLFELKKSKHSDLVGGYVRQLDVYQKSENALEAFYVVLRMTDKCKKIDKILEIQSDRKALNQKMPQIVVIDARLKESASKRK